MARRLSLFFLVIFLFKTGSSQTSQIEYKKIATFCKVWGFLKYYHPVVAKGSVDWDNEFRLKLRILNTITDRGDISDFYTAWINSLGGLEKQKQAKPQSDNSFKRNLDLDWLNDPTSFTSDLIKEFNFILTHRNTEQNFYVQTNPMAGNAIYENEKPYTDSIVPSVELRLLGLSRYWNIVNYFYPYKYKIDQSWDDVLVEMIPDFISATDTLKFHLAILELVVKLDDTHAGFSSNYTRQFWGTKQVPFYYKIIDEKAVIIGFYDSLLCEKDDIEYGDVILQIDSLTVQRKLEKSLRYISGSNQTTKYRNGRFLLNGQTDSIEVTFERGGRIGTKYIHRYQTEKFSTRTKELRDTFKVLQNNIGYVNLGLVYFNNVDHILDEVRGCAAIIFDVRNYPNGTLFKISNFLNEFKVPFVKFTIPDISYPGIFQYSGPLTCGKRNSKYYKGKVVLLFNEETQSHAEYTVMALKTAPNVIGIGSQTAGADGNVSKIVLPGGNQTYISGIGVYYPDNGETQRVGIVPDIEITPTLNSIKSRRDLPLEKAVEILTMKEE